MKKEEMEELSWYSELVENKTKGEIGAYLEHHRWRFLKLEKRDFEYETRREERAIFVKVLPKGGFSST